MTNHDSQTTALTNEIYILRRSRRRAEMLIKIGYCFLCPPLALFPRWWKS